MDKPLWGLRVQAPFGARVLSFVCCAPNDGFGPQSGLVQRGVLYAAAWGSENHTTALRAMEMHFPPLVPYGTTFPPAERWDYGRLAMEPCLCRKHRNLFCPLHRGGKGTRFVREQSDLRIV